MMIEYQIHYDENYIVESMKRYRSQNQTKLIRIIIKTICFIFLAALALFSIHSEKYMATIMISPFIILLLASPWLDFILLKHKLKKSPIFNDILKVSISPEGYSSVSSHSSTKVDWHCIEKATQLRDGILIFFSKTGFVTRFVWLPDSSIKTGTASQLNEVIKNNVINFKHA